jgi:ABC-type multidrug transport system fused ATPase/permease subunit
MENLRLALSLLSAEERRSGTLLLPLICLRGFADMLGVAMVFPFLKVLSEPSLISSNEYLAWAYRLGGFRSADGFVVFLGAALILVIVLTSAFKIATTYVINRWLDLRNHTLSKALLESYLRQPYEFILHRHSSDLFTTMLAEVNRIVMDVYKPLADVIVAFFTLLFMAGLLFVVDPAVTILAIVTLGLLYCVMFFVVRRMSSRYGVALLENNRLRQRFAWEALAGGKQVRLLNRERALVEVYEPASKALAETNAKSRLVRQAPRYIVESATIGGGIILCLLMISRYGGVGNDAISTTLPVLGIFVLAGYRMIPAFQNGYLSIVSLRLAGPSIRAVQKDLSSVALLPELPRGNVAPLRFREKIELRNVCYTYPGASAPSLKNVNLTIPSGASVGIVGETGAGKSTIMDIILGLIVPTEGEMMIDGRKLDHEQVRAWRANVGYVSQDIFLSDATVAQNIAFGLPDDEIDQGRVREVARMAQIEDVILSKLPEGFDTEIGERGVRLSGGQRQRISIARALYTEPEVLALDEATSALDKTTEALVMDEISRLPGTRTIIMVAHRLSTVRECDMIVTLEDGEVKSIGTWADLLKSDEAIVAVAGGRG